MAYFDDRKNAEEYIKMSDGYNGQVLVKMLKKHLPDDSSVLELGMGPGKDLDLLAENYVVTGSDSSIPFLDIYRESHPQADLMLLDAVTLDTERTFDAIFSNKVLVHLSKEDLSRSLSRQKYLLNENGVAMHSFWYGDNEEEYDGLKFVYYTEDTIRRIAEKEFDVLQIQRYMEIDKNDSLVIVLRKK